MCECGCGATEVQAAYQISGTQVVIGLQIFPGCEDCDYGPGVDVLLFDSPKSEWLEGVKIQKIKPDEYGGGGRGLGISVPIFDPENLRAEAKVLEESDPISQYDSLAEWLDEHGVALVQGAVARRRKQRGGLR